MPQTRTIEQTVYQFDELSDRAKERARDWYRGCLDENDFEFVIEDFKTIAEIIGITFDTHEVRLMSGKTRREPNIYWSGFSSQGDGACFEGTYRHTADSCAKIREHCSDVELHRIADELNRIQTANSMLGRPTLMATIKHSGRYYHEHSTIIEIDLTGHVDGKIAASEIETISELMRDLMHWLYKQLREEDEYLNSDEAIDDNILANEYEFDENGDRI